MKRWIAALAVASSTLAHALPVEVSAEYTLRTSGMTIGRVNDTFQRTGDRYTLRSTTRSEGALKLILDDSITLESKGRVSGEGLQPIEFEQRRAGDPSRDIHAVFDWNNGLLHSSYRGEVHEAPLPPGTQDRISVLYQFMTLGKSAIPRVEVQMCNGRKVDLYAYRFVDQVRIKTPAGDFDTFHYERITTGKEARAEVWLAKEHQNVPVRVVFDDPRGLRLEQVVVNLKIR